MDENDQPPAPREAPGLRDARGRFAPGNPGRPFGTRNRVSARVARAILAEFEVNQDDTLLRLRRWFLPQYVAMVSRLLPRDWEGEGGDGGGGEDRAGASGLPDAPSLADLRTLIDQLEAMGGEAVGPGADGAGTDIIGR